MIPFKAIFWRYYTAYNCFFRFLWGMKRLHSLFVIAIIFMVSACSNKFSRYQHAYAFKSANGLPNYAELNYWAAHPFKHDPSDSVPLPLQGQAIDTSVDVFFLHPTTYTESSATHIGNAPIDDALLNAKTDYTPILYQASVFNQSCRVFAPRYRQAHLKNFFRADKDIAAQVFDTAYSDLKTAFEYYLQQWNNGRPIIIAGHSQGALMAERLLKDYFVGKPLQNKLVVAYVIGWPVAKSYVTNISMCYDSLQTGCICSWRTLRKGFTPSYMRAENGNSYATNPLIWTMDNTYAPRTKNKGSVLVKFNKVVKHTTDAQLENGLLFVKKPKFPWSFLYFTKNYHVGDINLFYVNLQEDIKRRIGLYWKG
ncbi:MAG: hypothetical protein RIR12_2119 [Bacteroidota bacterium]|jgi:hypothetical protein